MRSGFVVQIFIVLAFTNIFAEKLVDLTITERAGVNRVKEPILMGVPLPESGLMSDTALFTLRDASNTILPCEFRVATRWLNHRNAIRFLHLDFQTDVAANQTRTVSLHSETAPYSAVTGLSVVDNGATLTVNTGVLRFIVRKANFNLIDQAWIDESGNQDYDAAHQLIATHNNGLTHTLNTHTYSSANDANSTVTIERQGPMAAVLKAVGVLKSAGGDSTLNYTTRIYAYAGSKIVRLENTVEYRHTNPLACTYFTDIRAVLPLSLSAANTLVAKAGGYDAATLASGQKAHTFSRRRSGSLLGVDVVNGGQAPMLTYNPVLTKPRDLGWVSLSDNAKGVVAGFNWFWEMYPQGMEVNGDGNLIINFYSGRCAENLQVFAGISRTQEVRLVFFNDDTPDEQRAQVVGVRNRLFAVAPADWYCHKTYGIGRLVPPRQSLYESSDWTVVQAMESKYTSHWNAVRNEVSSRLGLDTYGYLNYGDGLHYIWSNPAVLWDRAYDGNYYDLPHMAFQAFARTGNIVHLEHANLNANHIEDIHQGHFGPAHGMTGGCRYSPATNHCVGDPPENDSAHVHIESHASHHKTQSMFENWLLLGDRRALETSVEAWNWISKFGVSCGQGDDINVYCRRAAHIMESLCYAYYHTKQSKYLIQLMGIWSNLQDWIANSGVIGQTFMWGFLTESVVDYYYLLGDEPVAANYGDSLDLMGRVFFQTYYPYSTQDSVKKYLARWADNSNRIQYGLSNTSLGYGFLAANTNPALRATCIAKVNLFSASPYSNTNKDFALNGRANYRALFYLAIPDSVNSPISIESEADAAAGGPLSLCVSPNPCNPSALIRLNGKIDDPNAAAELSIYTVSGGLIKRTKTDMRTLAKGYVWNAGGLPSGVYAAKLRAGNKVLSRTITFLK
ncbi:MAG: hypothetical protein V1913_02035 [Fibrobacterota bacterium]